MECMYAFGANITHVYSLAVLSWHIFLYIILFYLQLMAAYIRNIVNCKYKHHVAYGSTKLKQLCNIKRFTVVVFGTENRSHLNFPV